MPPLIRLVWKCLFSVTDSPKGAGGESSSLDEDSSDALSPDQLTNHDSPLSAVPQLSPPDVLTQNGDMSPPQVPLQRQIKRGSLEFELIQTKQNSDEMNLPWNKASDDKHDHTIN